MSRSVSVPSNAVAVSYAIFEGDPGYDGDWDCSLECMREVMRKAYPSLKDCDEWVGREDRAVMRNRFCVVTVSEYNGVVAVALVPNADNNFSDSWCGKVNLAKAADCYGERMIAMGRFSNGEEVFRSALINPGKVGAAYSSKEGWLP